MVNFSNTIPLLKKYILRYLNNYVLLGTYFLYSLYILGMDTKSGEDITACVDLALRDQIMEIEEKYLQLITPNFNK